MIYIILLNELITDQPIAYSYDICILIHPHSLTLSLTLSHSSYPLLYSNHIHE